MDTPVVKPAVLDCGTAAPGSSATQQCQLHAPSDAVVTAAIVQDSAHIVRVKQIASYDLVPGVGPHPNTILGGQAALPVTKGQLVAVDVEAAPAAGSSDVLNGVLEIRGTGWTPVRRPLRVTTG
jgi:hypothetical protein